MNQLTLFEFIMAVVTLPFAIINFFTSEILDFIFLDLFNLGATTAMIMM